VQKLRIHLLPHTHSCVTFINTEQLSTSSYRHWKPFWARVFQSTRHSYMITFTVYILSHLLRRLSTNILCAFFVSHSCCMPHLSHNPWFFFVPWPHSPPPRGPGYLHYRGFTNTLRHTTTGRTPLDEWSARRKDFYRTKHDTHERQTSMPAAGFESTIPESRRPQINALDSSVIGEGHIPWFTGR
jgi:hypothetical protein